jgi:hypothetical protein
MRMLTLVFLAIFGLISINGNQISSIVNGTLIPINNETIFHNDTSVNKCLCIMLNSTNIFSVNYFSNNLTCQLFFNNNSTIKINRNSTIYFRQLNSELSETTTIMYQTSITTNQFQTISSISIKNKLILLFIFFVYRLSSQLCTLFCSISTKSGSSYW